MDSNSGAEGLFDEWDTGVRLQYHICKVWLGSVLHEPLGTYSEVEFAVSLKKKDPVKPLTWHHVLMTPTCLPLSWDYVILPKIVVFSCSCIVQLHHKSR
jgi:hypothetical protein